MSHMYEYGHYVINTHYETNRLNPDCDLKSECRVYSRESVAKKNLEWAEPTLGKKSFKKLFIFMPVSNPLSWCLNVYKCVGVAREAWHVYAGRMKIPGRIWRV
jgi:hypothetical protein